jgi:ribosomal protein S18 acetylase RimI-like enzyme
MGDADALREATPDELPALEPLWRSLYEHQRLGGMLLEVPDDGFARWAESLAPVLGRFGCLFVASQDGEPVGFLAGRVRSAPAWFGGAPVGFVSEVYVDPGQRGRGLGEDLVAAAQRWFRDREIDRIELQVLAGNDGARRLYRRLGWREELVQMVSLPG